LFDAGWSGTSVNITTTTQRYQFGDLNRFSGDLTFTGTWDGILSQTVWVRFNGPVLSSSPENPLVHFVAYGGNFNPAQCSVDNIGGVNYLKFDFSNNLPTSSTTYSIKIGGITIY